MSEVLGVWSLGYPEYVDGRMAWPEQAVQIIINSCWKNKSRCDVYITGFEVIYTIKINTRRWKDFICFLSVAGLLCCSSYCVMRGVFSRLICNKKGFIYGY